MDNYVISVSAELFCFRVLNFAKWLDMIKHVLEEYFCSPKNPKFQILNPVGIISKGEFQMYFSRF